MMCHRLTALLALLPATGFLKAQIPAPPNFIVHTAQGPSAPAPLEKLAEDWTIQMGGKTPRAVVGNEWISLRREGVSLPPFPKQNVTVLTSGDRIPLEPGTPFRLEDERLYFRPHQGAEIGVPLAFLSYLCMRVPEGVDDPALFLARLDRSKRPRDVMYLKSGDRIEGTLVSPTRGLVTTMLAGERSVETPFDQIAILAMNTELQARPKGKKTFAQIVSTRGARLKFSSMRLDPARGALTGKTLFGANWEVPLDQVAALTLQQGLAVYLSDLTPKVYQATPFLGVKWPLVADATVGGRQLFLGGNFYDKGIGMHTQSQVTYSLGGHYCWFEAVAGLEERFGKLGQAKVSVLVDGNAVLPRKELTERNSLLPVRIDVRAARELTLRVDFGDFGDVQGQVNWGDARLIRVSPE